MQKEEALAKDFLELLGKHVENKDELTYLGFNEFRTCFIFRFGIYKTPHKEYPEIFIKIFKREKSEDINRNPSRNEYEFLRQLNLLLSDVPWITIPKPIMLLPKQNGFAMDAVYGTDLHKLTSLYGGRFTSQKQKLKMYYKNVGKAIGLIQAMTYKPASNKAELYINMELDRILKKQIRSAPRIYLNYIKQAINCVKEAILTFSWENVGIAWTHGDFVHSNIKISEQNRVGIIDFSESRFDSPYFDLSRFTLRTLLNYSPFRIKYSSCFLNELNNDFLKGYELNSVIEFDESLYNIYTIFILLREIDFLFNTNLRYFLSPKNWYGLLLLRRLTRKYRDSDRK